MFYQPTLTSVLDLKPSSVVSIVNENTRGVEGIYSSELHSLYIDKNFLVIE
jgi:hypothetical protein